MPDAAAPGACQVVGSCQCVAGGEPARPEEGITTPTYVYSDVHGHRATLERALERVSPSEQDRFFCLGDMIDRGPDPLGVIAITRALPNVCVLKGNHEDLMLRALRGADQVEMSMCAMDWAMNGGSTTSDALEALDDEDASMVVDWVERLPCWAQVRVGERDYILTHAGIDPWRVEVPAAWDEGSIERLMAAQRPDDLLWIRDDFWTSPTGLVNERERGPSSLPGTRPRPTSRECSGKPAAPRATRTGWRRWSRSAPPGQPVAWLTVGTLTPEPPAVPGLARSSSFAWTTAPVSTSLSFLASSEGRSGKSTRGRLAPDGAGGPSRFSPWGRAAEPWPYLPALWLRTFCGMVAQLGW